MDVWLEYRESWAPKNWYFWAVVLEKTLESLLDCKEIQPVHPKGILPGCSLEGLMLNLKFQYFCHLMRRVDSLEKTLMLGGIGGSFFTTWATKEASYKLPVVFYLFEVVKPNNFYYDGFIWLYRLLNSKTYIHENIMEFI